MLKSYVKEAGGNPDAVAACVAQPETEKRIRQSIALGEKVGVNSTPTFYINGRRLVGLGGDNVPYDVVKEMVDFEISQRKQVAEPMRVPLELDVFQMCERIARGRIDLATDGQGC